MNNFTATGPLVVQRLIANWRLLLVLAFGILVSATLLGVSPVYTRVMNDLGLHNSLEKQIGSASRNGASLINVPLGDPATIEKQKEVVKLIAGELGWLTAEDVRYGALPSFGVIRGDGPIAANPEFLAKVQGVSGLEEHVRLVDGRFAEPTDDPAKLEAVMPIESARILRVQLGDRIGVGYTFDECNRPPPTSDPAEQAARARFGCVPRLFVERKAFVIVVGFVQQLDPLEAYWGTTGISFFTPAPNEQSPAIGHVVLPEQSFFQGLPKVMSGVASEFRFTTLADITRLNSANLSSTRDSLERLERALDDAGAIPDIAMATPLGRFENRAAFNQVPLLLMLLQVVGISLYYVFLVSTLLAERRSEEVAMLRSRGATLGQVVALSAAEAVCLALVAALAAPFLASGAVSLLGKTGTFESVSGGDFLPYVTVPASFLFALLGAAMAVLAVVGPAFIYARRSMALFLHSAARPGKPFMQRYYIDLVITGAAALALWQLNQKGSVYDPRSVGGWSADPFLLLSPFLLITAVGALMFRFLPLILRLISRVVSATAGPGVTLGLWQLTRSPARYTQLALLVVMAAAVGTFAATYGETTDRSQEERALFSVGTDLRVTGLSKLRNEEIEDISAKLEEIDGVEQTATAYRGSLPLGPLPNLGRQIPILALDPETAPSLVWFRDDFAGEELQSLLNRIRGSPSGGQGIPVPGQAEKIAMWVYVDAPRVNTNLWVRIADANGVYRFHDFGLLDFSGYRRLEASVPKSNETIAYPISIVSIAITQARNTADPISTMIIDDIVGVDASGTETMIEDFEGQQLRWTTIPTPTRFQDAFQRTNQNAHSGSGAGLYTFRIGTGVSLRGIYASDPNIPLPALASKRFLQAHDIRVGAQVDLVLGQVILPLTVQGEVDLFPTMPDEGEGFLIVNQRHLFSYVDLTSELTAQAPNEIWLDLTENPEDRALARTALYEKYGVTKGQIVDVAEVLKEIQTDPVVRAGGSGVLLLALLAAFSILGLGFALTLYLGGQQRTVEVSVMRAVGLSPRQVFTMISLEYLLVAAVGLALGTIAGLRISDTMLSFLNVTETGGRVIPPFALVTRWDTVAIAFAATGIAFLAGVIGLAFYFLRMPVSRVLRLTR